MITSVEIKNLKHVSSMSHETYCFTGTLFINGQKRGEVSNHGHGGCNMFSDRKAAEEVDAYAKSLPPVKTSFGEFEQDGDSLITDIVHWQIIRKDLQRNLKKRVMFIENGKLMQTNTARTSETLARWVDEMKNERSEVNRTILNLLSLDDAVSAYRASKALA